MDYIYSQLSSRLLDLGKHYVYWDNYTELPTASEDYYMTEAVVGTDYDTVYRCIKSGGGYAWIEVCHGVAPTPTLDAPSISLASGVVSWGAVSNATSYKIYSNATLLTTVSTTSYNLATALTEAGTYVITVRASASGYNDSVDSNSKTYTILPDYGKLYWGCTSTVPVGVTGLTEEDAPSTILQGITKTYTTSGSQYEVICYKASVGSLVHIYQNDLTTFDLISQFTKITVQVDNVDYYLYYGTQPVIESNSKYDFKFS